MMKRVRGRATVCLNSLQNVLLVLMRALSRPRFKGLLTRACSSWPNTSHRIILSPVLCSPQQEEKPHGALLEQNHEKPGHSLTDWLDGRHTHVPFFMHLSIEFRAVSILYLTLNLTLTETFLPLRF